MVTLDFIVEMTKAVAWPIAAIAIAIIFRKTIPNLIERLSSFKYGGFEAAFANQAANIAENITRTSDQPPSFVDSDGERLLSLAQESPRAAVLEAWLRVERKLHQLAEERHVDIRNNPMTLVRSLRDAQAISSETERALNGLRQLRNLAVHAHSDELSSQKAIEFVTYASALLWTMNAPPKI
ncbi:hypothetical protein [Telmatospirillum sp.]|uniref:hypothetical protein n=1 Tax=Telmatospirillum sp. TaxID=2079197 RepID=UPI0028513E16|nr:hypothetical protein [Telmatospirillum sp.]MDR3436314.1 hypothetical protein [Telmatospirillum sp.]